MKNFIGQGNKITITAAASGLSGAPVVLEDRVGIAEHAHAAADDLVVLLEGLVSLAKDVALVFTVGEKLYWDVADANLTDDDDTGTNLPIGWAAEAVASGSITSAIVKLGAW